MEMVVRTRMLKNDVHYLGLLFGTTFMELSMFVCLVLAYETILFEYWHD
jgi:hypothetical protein